jgi:hypothetical protein
MEPRTRTLLKAVAGLLRSVSPEDSDTDILLHDMARRIGATLDRAEAGRPVLEAPAEGGQPSGGSILRAG